MVVLVVFVVVEVVVVGVLVVVGEVESMRSATALAASDAPVLWVVVVVAFG